MTKTLLFLTLMLVAPLIVNAKEPIKFDLESIEPIVIQGTVANKEYCTQDGAPYAWDADYNSCYLQVNFYDNGGMRIYLNEDESLNRKLTIKGLKENK